MAGKSPEDAIALALNTSGRAVLFAGTTVCIAMLGLLLLGVQLPQRRRGRHRDRGAVHDARRRHAAARVPRHHPDEGAQPAGAPPARRGGPARGPRGRLLGALGGLRPAPPDAAGDRRRRCSCSCSRSRSSRCASAPPTRATTRRPRPRARPTTCSPSGFGPGFNGPLQLVAQGRDDAALAKLSAAVKQAPGGRLGRAGDQEQGRRRRDHPGHAAPRAAGRADQRPDHPAARPRRPRHRRRHAA